MTKKEFIQKAAISMASKVIGTNGIADNGDWEKVVIETEALAEALEKGGYSFEDTVK